MNASIQINIWVLICAFFVVIAILKRRGLSYYARQIVNNLKGIFRSSIIRAALIDRLEVRFKQKALEQLVMKYQVKWTPPLANGTEPSGSLLVVVPFWNNFEIALELLQDIEARLSDHLDYWANVDVLVADDASSPVESEKMRRACESLGFNYERNEVNLGFLGNTNLAYQRAAGYSHVLLLNSDVRLPKHFFARLEVHAADEDTALLTVPSFEDLVGWGAMSPTWFEFDDRLASFEGNYIQACTAVGYCLLVNTKAIPSPLFDPDFGHGYGEDSDLHMRVDQQGKKSLLALDMCVFHAGGASYGEGHEAQGHRAQGAKLFHEKWGHIYRIEFPFFHREIQRYVASIPAPTSEKNEIWLLTPRIGAKGVGGLRVFEHTAGVLAKDMRAVRLVSLTDGGTLRLVDGALMPTSLDEFSNFWKRVDLVEGEVKPALYFGGNVGINLVYNNLALFQDRFRLFLLLQGPDFYMDPHIMKSFEPVIAQCEQVIAASDYLAGIAYNLGAKSVTKFQPQIEVYETTSSSREIINRSRDLIVSIRGEHGKAPWLSETIANYFASKGWRVASFGSEKHRADPAVEKLGVLTPFELQNELARTKVYFDSSLYEGFGLTPREALAKGTRVVAVENGGNDELQGVPGIELVRAWSFVEIVEAIERNRNSDSADFCIPVGRSLHEVIVSTSTPTR